jgi:hypothetical protein
MSDKSSHMSALVEQYTKHIERRFLADCAENPASVYAPVGVFVNNSTTAQSGYLDDELARHKIFGPPQAPSRPHVWITSCTP